MARHKTPWRARHTLLLFIACYLCLFFVPVFFSILNHSLAFVLAHAPFFFSTFLLALLPAIGIRRIFVETIQPKRLGVLVDRHGNFKALLPPHRYFIFRGWELVKELLSLEPIATQMPVLGLKASNGDVGPQVVIFTWRVRADVQQLLAGPHQQQITSMAMAGSQQRERSIKAYLELAIKQRMLQRTISQLETELADKINRPFEQDVLATVNPLLEREGLVIDTLELIGTIAPPTRAASGAPGQAAEAARKQLAEARKKLQALLNPPTPDTTAQEVTQRAWAAYQKTSQVRKDIHDLSAALHAYMKAISDVLDPLIQQAQPRPKMAPIDKARKNAFDRLQKLQEHVGNLGSHLIYLEQQAKRIKAPPFGLTPTESQRLLEVLEAIERKMITLEKLYP